MSVIIHSSEIIIRIETAESIQSVYRDYLDDIGRFLEVAHHDSWRNRALKNLRDCPGSGDRHIYVLKNPEAIIGFAMVSRHLRFNRDGHAVAEFYIRKKYERNGFGRRLTEFVFEQFPGNWEVAVAFKNTSARMFWEQVISSYTHGCFQEKKKDSFYGSGFVFSSRSVLNPSAQDRKKK